MRAFDPHAGRMRNSRRMKKNNSKAIRNREKSSRTVFAELDYVQDSKLDLISHKSPVLRSYDFKKKLQ